MVLLPAYKEHKDTDKIVQYRASFSMYGFTYNIPFAAGCMQWLGFYLVAWTHHIFYLLLLATQSTHSLQNVFCLCLADNENVETITGIAQLVQKTALYFELSRGWMFWPPKNLSHVSFIRELRERLFRWCFRWMHKLIRFSCFWSKTMECEFMLFLFYIHTIPFLPLQKGIKELPMSRTEINHGQKGGVASRSQTSEQGVQGEPLLPLIFATQDVCSPSCGYVLRIWYEKMRRQDQIDWSSRHSMFTYHSCLQHGICAETAIQLQQYLLRITMSCSKKNNTKFVFYHFSKQSEKRPNRWCTSCQICVMKVA